MNPELKKLFDDDQAPRTSVRYSSIDWQMLSASDELRRHRVAVLAEEGLLVDALDYKHAAMIFQHSSNPEDYLQAHRWALRSVELDGSDMQAKNLVLCTYDRYLLASGNPQIYGTQIDLQGQCIREPFNPEMDIDAKRTNFGLPPLLEVIRQLAIK